MTLRERLSAAVRASRGSDAVGAIGCELGDQQLELVQLARSGDALRIVAVGSASLPRAAEPGADRPLARAVRGALSEQGFRGRRIVTAMPDADVRLMVVNYQVDASRPDDQVILGLVEERIGDAIEQYVVDYRPIRVTGDERGARSSLVAVARREAVIGQLELLRRAGLRVEALEIAPVAIHRLVSWLGRGETAANELLLHCGRKRSHLIVIAGRRLILYRELDFGEDLATEAVAKSLDMDADAAASVLRRYGPWPDHEGRESWDDPAEALEIAETVGQILKPSVCGLTEEIDRAGVYTASQWRGAGVERIWLLGSFASWPRIDRLLESLVSLPVRVLDPLAALTGGDRGSADPGAPLAGASAVAAGLALRGLDGDE
jgi:type IV pilus assembly protein PilM